MKQLGTLNFANMTQEQRMALGHFFSNNKDKNIFQPGSYTVEIKKEKYTFKIPHLIVRRKRASNPKEDRFEIQGDFLASGSFGDVYKVLGTLALQYDNSVKFKNRTRRVMKVQMHNTSNPVANLFKEFGLTNAIKDLHVKEPVLDGNDSYTVMREAIGDDLWDIHIKDTQANHSLLSVNDRFSLTIETLYAIQRMHEFGVIHNDLKLENAKFDLASKEAKIFDLGLSKFRDEKITKLSGTPICMAPEQMMGEQTNELSDAFLTGIMLASIWGGINLRELFKGSMKDMMVWAIQNRAQNQLKFESELFTRLPLDTVLKVDLKKIFYGMTKGEPKERTSIPSAITDFESLRLKYLFRVTDSSDHALIQLAHDKGRELRNAMMDKINPSKNILRSDGKAKSPQERIKNIQDEVNIYLDQISQDEDKYSDVALRIAYSEFCEMSRIKAFKDLDSKKAIQEKMSMIVNTLQARFESLLAIADELEKYNAGINFSPDIDRPAISALIRDILDYLMTKDIKYGYTLDGLESLNERYEYEIQSLNANPLLLQVRYALQNPHEELKKLLYTREEMQYSLALFVANSLPDVVDKETYARENYKELTPDRVLNSKRNTLKAEVRKDVADLLTIITEAKNVESLFEEVESRLKTIHRGFFGKSKLEEAVKESIEGIKESLQEHMKRIIKQF